MQISLVSIIKTDSYVYPDAHMLFRPDTAYAEYPFKETAVEMNSVYAAVREAMYALELDTEHYGTAQWNPLGKIIVPGNTVLLKPNLVMDVNRNQLGGTDCLYTQPAVVAAAIDYVVIALKGEGKIVVGDAPMQECDFERLIRQSGYDKLIQYYKDKGIDIELVDFRQLKSTVKAGEHYSQINDAATGKIVKLNRESEFSTEKPQNIQKMRVTNYDPRIMSQHHNADTHEYFVSDYVLQADVIINLPKPKSHRKAGFTAALKNLVGINTRKEFLPHHTRGGQEQGGDEYLHSSIAYDMRSMLIDRINIYAADNAHIRARLLRLGTKACSLILCLERKKYSEGSWYGNHTISRTITDLNKIILYADKNGVMQDRPVRKMMIIADMIVSGEKEGPVFPSPKNVGIIAAGLNPVCFDEAICTVMGFDVNKVPTLTCARASKGKYKIVSADEVPFIVSNAEQYNGKMIKELSAESVFHFIPSSGWQGHIEIT